MNIQEYVQFRKETLERFERFWLQHPDYPTDLPEPDFDEQFAIFVNLIDDETLGDDEL